MHLSTHAFLGTLTVFKNAVSHIVRAEAHAPEGKGAWIPLQPLYPSTRKGKQRCSKPVKSCVLHPNVHQLKHVYKSKLLDTLPKLSSVKL